MKEKSRWHASGRINIIGEHTDYQGGFSLPIAIGLGLQVTVVRRTDNRLQAKGQGPHRWHGSVAELRHTEQKGFAAFLKGAMMVSGLDFGVNITIDGNLPIESGLSSSAALSLGLLCAFYDLMDVTIPKQTLVSQARFIENTYVGVPCGIMDQMAIAYGEPQQAILVDAKQQTVRLTPFAYHEAHELWIIDTKTPRHLAAGGYAQRVAETSRAAELCGVDFLVDASRKDVSALADPMLRKRAQHVLEENDRVQTVVRLAEEAKWDKVKEKINESHASLRDLFEVSLPLLDQTQRILATFGCGARLVGAGFGGSLIALCPKGAKEMVTLELNRVYEQKGWPYPVFLSVPKAEKGLYPLYADHL